MSAATPAASPAQTLRILALTLCSSPVVVLVAIWFVLPSDGTDPLSLPVALGVVGAVAAGFVAARAVGYRTAPLPAGLDEDTARERSLATYQQLMIVRFVATEAPIILALALSFVVDQGPWPYVLAVVVGVPSMVLHVLPRPATTEKVRAALEADGSRSYLEEALGS